MLTFGLYSLTEIGVRPLLPSHNSKGHCFRLTNTTGAAHTHVWGKRDCARGLSWSLSRPCWKPFRSRVRISPRPRSPKRIPPKTPSPAVAQDRDSKRQTDWAERDLAIILTALLAGLRSEELRHANVGDIRTTDDGAAVIHVKGKVGKERSVPIEAELLSVIQTYLDSRALRFAEGRRATAGSGLPWRSARTPLFVGRDGQRISQGTLQSRIKRAFKRAGPDAQPVPGALIHGLRHTYATELAAAQVSVYTLMKLLGHESMTTSQRYVTAAGSETRSAASQNPLYALVPRSP
jgi:integrase/recombinase XerC